MDQTLIADTWRERGYIHIEREMSAWTRWRDATPHNNTIHPHVAAILSGVLERRNDYVTEERETEAETRNDKETMKSRNIIWQKTGNVNSERRESTKECARYYGDGGNQRNSIASLVLVSCSFASGLSDSLTSSIFIAGTESGECREKRKQKSRRRKMCVCPSAASSCRWLSWWRNSDRLYNGCCRCLSAVTQHVTTYAYTCT